MKPTHSSIARGTHQALIGILLVGALSGCQRTEPLVITVLFYNAPALSPGDPVIYKSARIGEIAQVDAPYGRFSRHRIVEVHIDPEHVDLMYRQMAFTVDTIRLLKMQHKIVLMDRPTADRHPVQDDDVFIGTTYVQYLLGLSNEVAIGLIEELKSLLQARPLQPDTAGPGWDTRRFEEFIQRYIDQAQQSSGPTASSDTTSWRPPLVIRVN